MKIKLLNDLDIKNGKKALEVLKNNTRIFQNWNVQELSDLSEYMRFISFTKSTPLAKKNESVDYFGIIISGRALISSEGKVFGYLETGDMIGYLNFAKIQNTQTHFFDINGEKEGFIAAIRIEDYKTMSKKSPKIAFKLSQVITKKAFDTVHFQYRNEHLLNDIQPTPSILPPKRIVDMFEKSPAFQGLIKRMEKRDRSNFLKFAQLYEFNPKDLICRRRSRCHQMIFLLKGELLEFNHEDDSVTSYRPGDIIGLKEFYLDLSWTSNIIAKSEGCYLVLRSEHLEDIALENGGSAINLYNLFASYECDKIKAEYEKDFKDQFSSDFRFKFMPSETQKNIVNQEKSLELEKEKQLKESDQITFKKKPKDEKKVTFTGNEKAEDFMISNFLEIDVEKKIDQISMTSDKNKENLESYRVSYDIAPLYLHEIHVHYIEQPQNAQAKQQGGQQGGIVLPHEGISILFREKLEKQSLALQRLKQEQRQQRKMGDQGVTENKKLTTNELIAQHNEEYEELKNEMAIIDQTKQELERMLGEVKDENKKLRLEINKLNEVNILLNAKVNKNLVQRELVNKDILNQGAYATLGKQGRSIKDSFHTVLDQQLRLNRGQQLAAKCAYKWLNQTKKNILKKKTIVF
ncbi:cyclic nucleotide-binding domain protein (macronuclear) [Tetrahymena thermophila SB210]|uniref:Cyclic nucleotide-binding domain protein n=1 Tax=Tetrahymena thermophila (strain SB210) TaxID=312017 RepID=I7M2J2_TETTS|nr:cyclic nucleotide-binding domain protein [Tetrahymena thermophila SB210]EAS00560.3 cyclic nucleotide-binding domain protein [Tetrahymena thermophila SB210]|eukprot:XP_001020805.3 cyclic nucleotide-binding domain protein [Tetrahymena thermophila SB210]